MVAGAVASLISQFIVVPSDLVSQRMAVGIRNTMTIRGHFKELLKEAGVIGLYRGYSASVMTYAPASSVWWATYGFFKPRLRNLLMPRATGRKGAGSTAGPRHDGARSGEDTDLGGYLRDFLNPLVGPSPEPLLEQSQTRWMSKGAQTVVS